VKLSTLLASSILLLGTSCGTNEAQRASNIKIVDIPNTEIKWQSIGNCWIYAFTGWFESIVLQGKGEKLNISESYITYLNYKEQLLSPWMGTKLETGGFFHEAANLTLKHGFLFEGEFIPQEDKKNFSSIQKSATEYLTKSLEIGILKTDKTYDTVVKELEKAFGVSEQKFSSSIKNANEFIVSEKNETPVTLSAELAKWEEVNFPVVKLENEKLPKWNNEFTEKQLKVLKQVKRALNRKKPVVMNWFVDFNAMNSQGVFSHEQLKSKKSSGKQGYHSTVIEDYGVSGINPDTNEKFVLGEGELSRKEKKLSLEFGMIDFIIVKNSWGGNERLDRASYKRNGEGGFHMLKADYLFGSLVRINSETQEFAGVETGVNSFVLPIAD
jgi:hypothetical protein